MYLLFCLGNEGNDLNTSINDSTRHEYKEKEPRTKVANMNLWMGTKSVIQRRRQHDDMLHFEKILKLDEGAKLQT
jgi:hypothetical protein